MAVDVEKLLVSVEANLKQFEREMARANKVTVRELRAVERQASGMTAAIERRMSAFGTTLRAGLAGAVAGATAALGLLIRNAVSDAAKIGDLADKIGITTDQLQELQYGAVQAEIGLDELSNGLLRLSKNMGEARSGSGDLLKILEANGFDQAKVKAMEYEDVLRVVAELIKNAANEQDALLVSTAAFGRGEADKFLEFLKNGAQALTDSANAARNASSVIDGELIRKAQEWDDTWAAFMQSMKAQALDFALATAREFEVLGGIIDEFLEPLDDRTKQVLASRYSRFSPGGFRPIQPIPLDPALRGLAAASTGGAIKGDLPTGPTIIPDERAATAATKANTAAVREAAEAARDRAEALRDTKDALQDEWQAQLALLDDLNAQAAESVLAVQDSFQSLADLGLSAFERLAIGGENFADVMADVGRAIASAALQASLLGQGPLAGLFGATGGGGGFLGPLISSLTGGISGSLYHAGGTVGAGTMRRNVSPAAFIGAPRMHGGGIAGLRADEVPAILQRGEMVIPRLGRRSGERPITFQVINKNGSQIETSERQGPNGERVIQAIVDRSVDQKMKNQYGLSKLNTRR